MSCAPEGTEDIEFWALGFGVLPQNTHNPDLLKSLYWQCGRRESVPFT